MPACCGLPSGEQCPKKAKGIECKLGFGDDFFCNSCMVAQREHRLGKGDTNDQTSVKQALRRSSGRDKGSTNSANNSDVNLGSVNKDTILLDPLLSYVVFALQSGSVENMKNAVLGHFSNVDINLTKDLLWSHCGTEGIGEKPKRKGPNLRSEAEENLMDIISSWMKLDRANNTPIVAICAENLGTIPRSHPEELNAITLVDRLNQLEQRMTNMQTNMDCMMAHNMNLNDQVKDLSSYASRVKSPVVPVPVLTRDIHGNKTDAVGNHAESLPIDHTLHAVPKQTKQKVQSQNDFLNTLIPMMIPMMMDFNFHQKRYADKGGQPPANKKLSPDPRIQVIYVEHQSQVGIYLYTGYMVILVWRKCTSI